MNHTKRFETFMRRAHVVALLAMLSSSGCDRILGRKEDKVNAGTSPKGVASAPIASSVTSAAPAVAPKSAAKSAAGWHAKALEKLPARVRALHEKSLSPKCPPGMAYVPKAKFAMGRAKDTFIDDAVEESHGDVPDEFPLEAPSREMTVDAFCIDVIPVTAFELATCREHGACPAATPAKDPEKRCPGLDESAADQSAECVDHRAATAYCTALQGRIPTEAEWELGGRGTDGRMYPWGTPKSLKTTDSLSFDEPRVCRTGRVDDRERCGVGRFPAGASPYGVLDMAGTHMEWTSSGFCDYAKPAECSTTYFAVRSGGDSDWQRGRLYARRSREASSSGMDLGFRCATQPTG